MDRKILTQAEYTDGEIATGIAVCNDMLQEAADYIFSLPELASSTHTLHTNEHLPDHRIIIGEPATLLLERPYLVGFYGLRSPDPQGEVTRDLLSVDNRLIEALIMYGVGLYNTARLHGEYINTAVLPDRSASKNWAADNSLHRAAVEKLAPRCYRRVLKFTGEIEGWPRRCSIQVDEVILIG